jgi:ethanolamine ammonia-lyase small subunit
MQCGQALVCIQTNEGMLFSANLFNSASSSTDQQQHLQRPDLRCAVENGFHSFSKKGKR